MPLNNGIPTAEKTSLPEYFRMQFPTYAFVYFKTLYKESEGTCHESIIS